MHDTDSTCPLSPPADYDPDDVRVTVIPEHPGEVEESH